MKQSHSDENVPSGFFIILLVQKIKITKKETLWRHLKTSGKNHVIPKNSKSKPFESSSNEESFKNYRNLFQDGPFGSSRNCFLLRYVSLENFCNKWALQVCGLHENGYCKNRAFMLHKKRRLKTITDFAEGQKTSERETKCFFRHLESPVRTINLTKSFCSPNRQPPQFQQKMIRNLYFSGIICSFSKKIRKTNSFEAPY